MHSLTKQRRWRLALTLLAALGLLPFSPGVFCADAAQPDDSQKRRSELHQLSEAWFKVIMEAGQARRKAKSPTELEQVRTELATKSDVFIQRCLALAGAHPGSREGIAALKLVACRAAETEGGRKAAETLVAIAASADLELLASALGYTTNTSERPLRRVAPIIVDRVRQAADHPQAARLLASVVCSLALERDEEVEPPPDFAEAADLIAARYSRSPDIVNFCELLGMASGSANWAIRFEKHLRTILEANPHREIRCAATFALASVLQFAEESRQDEAKLLYEGFLKTFDGKEDYPYAGIEKDLGDSAKLALTELKLRGLGNPVPEIIGVDLDGRDMKVSEYRGKVVLLSFWATWCKPCLAMIPHERDLVARLENKPFVLIGVNGDDDQEAARRAAKEHGITWRSFRQKNEQNGRTIQTEWSAVFPSFYLVDQAGVIRRRWTSLPAPEALNRAIDDLLARDSKNNPTD